MVSHGAVLGVGDKLFAIPWSVFLIDTRKHRLILDVNKETLNNAEGFDKGTGRTRRTRLGSGSNLRGGGQPAGPRMISFNLSTKPT